MISTKLAQELQYFVGKICTIVTTPMAIPLTAQQLPDWFTVRVDSIDTEVIWGTDVARNTKQLYMFPILGIVEEQMVDSNNPNYNKLKEKFNKNTTAEQEVAKPELKPVPGTYVPIDQLASQALELKKKYKEN